jgi:hypothetical protein
MAGITLTVDTSEVSRLSVTLARLMGQYEWIAARAMTESAKITRTALQREILPKIEGGPTNWTKRGLIVRYASRNNLQAMVGFQYGEGSFDASEFTRKAGGVPAGRYMGINARGGDRRPKGSELQLRRAGLIGNDQFLVPNAKGVRLNAQGNLPGAEYQRILSRLKGFSAAGSNQNTTAGAGSRGRSAAKRKANDYFVMRYEGGRPANRHTLGASPAFIARRVGRRGFVPALWITDQPNYERRFPIRVVAEREFARAFPIQFERALAKELEFQSRRR